MQPGKHFRVPFSLYMCSNQLATDATAVLVSLQPTDWTVDDLALTSQPCCVVPVVDKELEFEQAGTESLLQTVAFR